MSDRREESTPAYRGGTGRWFLIAGAVLSSAAVLEAPVRETAVVYINDQRIGSVWVPSYSVDVSGRLQPGDNQIRIETANLAVNHMVAHDYLNYNQQGVRQRFGNRFDPQDFNQLRPLPSGLLARSNSWLR